MASFVKIGVIGSLVSLVQRFRRSTGIERPQLRWLVTATGTVAILYASALVLSFNTSWGTEATPAWLGIIQTLALASFGLIPIAIGISVLRYHLFDIDVAINRALLLAAMVVFITLVYVAIVVGVGALVGSQSTPVLSPMAAAVIAWRSSRRGDARSGSPTASSTGSERRRTRCTPAGGRWHSRPDRGPLSRAPTAGIPVDPRTRRPWPPALRSRPGDRTFVPRGRAKTRPPLTRTR
jgi:hypothetical protein